MITLKEFKEKIGATLDEGIPPHLRKHLDKDGNKVHGSWKNGKWTPNKKQPKKSKFTITDVTPKGYGPNEEMDPTDHVKEKDGKFCVYNKDGEVAAEFDSEDEANAYARKNHDMLMGNASSDEEK